MRASIERAAALLLVVVVALVLAGWTAWTVATFQPDAPAGFDQAACDASGERYHEIAQKPGISIPDERFATSEEVSAARSARSALFAERGAALRDYAETCRVGAAALPA